MWWYRVLLHGLPTTNAIGRWFNALLLVRSFIMKYHIAFEIELLICSAGHGFKYRDWHYTNSTWSTFFQNGIWEHKAGAVVGFLSDWLVWDDHHIRKTSRPSSTTDLTIYGYMYPQSCVRCFGLSLYKSSCVYMQSMDHNKNITFTICIQMTRLEIDVMYYCKIY